MKKQDKLNIVIAYGGVSCEHDISIITALQIYSKYKSEKYEFHLLYLTKNGEWIMGRGLDNFGCYRKLDVTKFKRVTFLSGSNFLYEIKKNKLFKMFEVDLLVNCFHGGSGEDGRFAAFMEDCKICTSSSRYKSLGICMDKYLTKMLAIANDVSTIDFFCVSKKDWAMSRERVAQQLLQFDFPVVVKPMCQGSSIGVALALNYDEFVSAATIAFNYDDSIIVERAILKKREFNCCLLKMPSGEIVAKLDEPVSDKVVIGFSDKYLAGSSSAKALKFRSKTFMTGNVGMQNQQRKTNSLISGKLKSLLIKNSKLLYECLDMNGVVRMDYIYDQESGNMYLGEINAVPGSLGYYFFDGIDLIDSLYKSSHSYWDLVFGLKTDSAPTIFG